MHSLCPEWMQFKSGAKYLNKVFFCDVLEK